MEANDKMVCILKNLLRENEKEDQTMKTRLGVLIFVFLTGMVFGALQPALVYGGAECSGVCTFWSPFVNVSLFTGKPILIRFLRETDLSGPLSIYYYVPNPGNTCTLPGPGQYQPQAIMFYTVRLIGGEGSKRTIYWFDGTAATVPGTGQPICLGDTASQGEVIMSFLQTVISEIFPNAQDAYVKSVDNAGITPDSQAFVADVTVASEVKK